MNLSDGSGGNRHRVEFAKDLAMGSVQLLFYDAKRCFGRKGGNLVLEKLELAGKPGRHQVRPGSDHLGQLDKGGTKFGERFSEPLRGIGAAQNGRPVGKCSEAPEKGDETPEVDLIDEIAEAVPDKDIDDFAKAPGDPVIFRQEKKTHLVSLCIGIEKTGGSGHHDINENDLYCPNDIYSLI
jgi:hypothetical protein